MTKTRKTGDEELAGNNDEVQSNEEKNFKMKRDINKKSGKEDNIDEGVERKHNCRSAFIIISTQTFKNQTDFK